MVGDLNRLVRCVGLPMGGLCLDSNISYMQWCIEQGADVLIGGEADEYGFLFAADADIPCIETGHFVSETPGVLNFAKRLQKDFPAIKAAGYDNRRPFEYR
jgi:putative NIF3 family GTP cyclohydrolase 1 type 2